MDLNLLLIDEIVRMAILEDAPYGDITTMALEIRGKGSGYFLAKEDFVLCGIDIVKKVFEHIDHSIIIKTKFKDGNFIKSGVKFCYIEGKLSSILLGERTALNFLQRLSAIATKTYRAVNLLKGTRTTLLDTRKTTPLLRNLEKYAVRVGGGKNHRMGLSDAILIKDNHIAAVGSIKEAIKRAKKNFPMKKVEIEVKSVEEFIEAVKWSPDIVMLDNFRYEDIKKVLKIKPSNVEIELSGGVTLENLPSLSKLGVDYISLGSLTHTIKNVDISLEIERK